MYDVIIYCMIMCDVYDGLTVLYHNSISWMGNYANGKYMICITKIVYRRAL